MFFYCNLITRFLVVRLIGGGNKTHQGRVEVLFNGTWGTVCNNGWNLMDANVVCRELGFQGAMNAVNSAAFGRGQGKIWLDNVQCAGDESSLVYCNHSGWGKSDCSHSEDAGVVCIPKRGNKNPLQSKLKFLERKKK